MEKSVEISFDYLVGAKSLPENAEEKVQLEKEVEEIKSVVPVKALAKLNLLKLAVVSPGKGETERAKKLAKKKKEKKKRGNDDDDGDGNSGGAPGPAKKKKAAVEPSNWAEIKKENGWPAEAEWFPGRDKPNQDGSIPQKRGRPNGTSVDKETNKLIYPEGTGPPRLLAASVNTIMPTPCRQTGGGTAGAAADEGTVQWLQEQLEAANRTNVRLTEKLNENMRDFGEWKSDDGAKREYAEGREQLHTANMVAVQQTLTLYHAMAKTAFPALPDPMKVGEGIMEFNWKW